MTANEKSLTELPTTLRDCGFAPVPRYRKCEEYARSAKFPCYKKQNGRWYFDVDQIDAIASTFGCASTGLNKADEPSEYETVSYNVPLHLIDLYRDLADARHRVNQAERRRIVRENRQARKNGVEVKDPCQARRSASAVVVEAMEAYADTVRAELEGFKQH